jgi:hypothetical protein
VGSGKTVTVSGISIGGADAGNYNLLNTTATTTADITAKDLTVVATAANKVYDGTTDASVTLSSDALSGDDVTLAFASAAFADKNVGSGKTVTVSGISIGGADAGNYNLLNTTATTTADITPKDLTVTADDKTINVGDPDPTFTYTVTGFIAPDTFLTEPVCSVSVPHSVPGTYPIVCSGADAGANYTIQYVNGTLTVNAVNNPPTDITLSNSSVDENQPVGTLVGSLTATDPDPGDTHTFTFCGGADDASFQLSGNNLLTNAVFDYETKASYDICIRADDGHGGTLDKPFTITVNNLPEPITATFRSAGAQDGWILESSEVSGSGGSLNATATTFNLGDDALDRQYRAILSFDTAALPDNATIISVTLKIKRQGIVGTNPFLTHGKILVDIRKGSFGTAVLQLTDFKALASKNGVAQFVNAPLAGNWYSVNLNPAAFSFVNKAGLTQFRLRFAKDDNDDMGADYLKFFSGNAALAYRPVLIIQYTLP